MLSAISRSFFFLPFQWLQTFLILTSDKGSLKKSPLSGNVWKTLFILDSLSMCHLAQEDYKTGWNTAAPEGIAEILTTPPLGSWLVCPHIPADKDPAHILTPLPYGWSCAKHSLAWKQMKSPTLLFQCEVWYLVQGDESAHSTDSENNQDLGSTPQSTNITRRRFWEPQVLCEHFCSSVNWSLWQEWKDRHQPALSAVLTER